jgi:hypothetical protein
LDTESQLTVAPARCYASRFARITETSVRLTAALSCSGLAKSTTVLDLRKWKDASCVGAFQRGELLTAVVQDLDSEDPLIEDPLIEDPLIVTRENIVQVLEQQPEVFAY